MAKIFKKKMVSGFVVRGIAEKGCRQTLLSSVVLVCAGGLAPLTLGEPVLPGQTRQPELVGELREACEEVNRAILKEHYLRELRSLWSKGERNFERARKKVDACFFATYTDSRTRVLAQQAAATMYAEVFRLMAKSPRMPWKLVVAKLQTSYIGCSCPLDAVSERLFRVWEDLSAMVRNQTFLFQSKSMEEDVVTAKLNASCDVRLKRDERGVWRFLDFKWKCPCRLRSAGCRLTTYTAKSGCMTAVMHVLLRAYNKYLEHRPPENDVEANRRLDLLTEEAGRLIRNCLTD